MAKLKPVVAKDLRSLELHLNNSEPVILIFNNKLIPEIKKRVKEDQDNRNLNGVVKGLAVAGVGLILLPVSGLFFGSLLVGGLLVSANKIWKRIHVKLGEYTWSESEINSVNILLLSKKFGDNKLFEDDEIDLTDLESILKEEYKQGNEI